MVSVALAAAVYFGVYRNSKRYQRMAATLVEQGRIDDAMHQFRRAVAFSRGKQKRERLLRSMAESIRSTRCDAREASKRWLVVADLQIAREELLAESGEEVVPLERWYLYARSLRPPRLWELCRQAAELRAGGDDSGRAAHIAQVAEIELLGSIGDEPEGGWKAKADGLRSTLESKDDPVLRALYALCLGAYVHGVHDLNPAETRELANSIVTEARKAFVDESADLHAQVLALRILAAQSGGNAWRLAQDAPAFDRWLNSVHARAEAAPRETVELATALADFVQYYAPPAAHLSAKTEGTVRRARECAAALVRSAPDSTVARAVLAKLAILLGDTDEAREHLQWIDSREDWPVSLEAVAANTEIVPARVRLAEVALDRVADADAQDRPAALVDAENRVARATASLHENATIRQALVAQLQIHRGQTLQAIAGLEKTFGDRSDAISRARLAAARAFLDIAQPGRAAKLLKMIRRSHGRGLSRPQYRNAETLLVETLLDLGHSQDAEPVVADWGVPLDGGAGGDPVRWLLTLRTRILGTTDQGQLLEYAKRLEESLPALPPPFGVRAVLACQTAYRRAGLAERAASFVETAFEERQDSAVLAVELLRLRLSAGEIELAESAAGRIPALLPAGKVRREIERLSPAERCEPAAVLLLQATVHSPETPESGWFAYLARNGHTAKLRSELEQLAGRGGWRPTEAFRLFQELHRARRVEALRLFAEAVASVQALDWLADLARADANLLEGSYVESLHTTERLAEEWPFLGEVWHIRADAALNLERYRDARVSYRQAVAARPDDVSLHLGLFRCQHALGEHEEALRWLRGAVQCNPTRESWEHFLDYAAAHGDKGGVIRVRRRLAEDQPDDTDNLLALADLLESEGKNAAAGELLRRCIELADPPSAALVVSTARNEWKRGDREAALARVTEFSEERLRAELTPAEATGLLPVCRFLHEVGEATRAAKMVYAVLERVPQTDRTAWLQLLARIRLEADQPGRAVETLTTPDGEVADPSLAPLLLRSLVLAGQFDRGEELLEQARRDPAYPDMTVAEAGLALARKQWERAIRKASQAIETNPNSIHARSIRAEAAMASEKREFQHYAREDTSFMERMAPEHPALAMLLRRAIRQAAQEKDVATMESLAKRLDKVDGDSPYHWFLLGKAYVRTDQFDALRDKLPEWRRRFPDEDEFLLMLAEERREAGDVEGQRDALERALRTPSTRGALLYAEFLLEQRELKKLNEFLATAPAKLQDTAAFLEIRARLRLLEARPRDAVADLSSAFSRLQDTPDALFAAFRRARSWMGAERLETLLTDYAREAGTSAGHALLVLASELWRNAGIAEGRIVGAKDYLATMPEDHPLVTRGWQVILEAWHRMNRPKEAAAVGRRLIEDGVRRPSVLNNYAYACALIGEDLEGAAAWAQDAIERAESDRQKAAYYDTLALLYERMGRIGEAGDALASSIQYHEAPYQRVRYARLLAEQREFFEAGRQLSHAAEQAKEANDSKLLGQIDAVREQYPGIEEQE